MPISLRTSLLSLGCHLAQPLLYRLKSTLSNAVNVLSVKIQECENSTDSENCECDTTSCVSFFYCWYNIPLHHNFTCIRGFRVCLIQLLVFSHQCIHIKVSEQIQTNTCHQDLLAYLSVRRQPIYITNSQHTWQQRLKNYRLPLFTGALKFQSHSTGQMPHVKQMPAINHNITASKCNSKQSENTRNGADVQQAHMCNMCSEW